MSLIDTIENSSFLDQTKLEKIKAVANECIKNMKKQKKKADILKSVQKYFTFERVFATRGVQGIAGLLNYKNDKIVFKISIDLDRSIEHENIVTTELNKIRKYCPHFVGNIGMINIPVSNEFIDDPDEHSLFKNSQDYFPCNVLLLEYISRLSLSDICYGLHKDSSIIITFLSQVMMALDIAQTKCKFTSYDLHLDNILARQIESNSLFLYINKGHSLLIPTYGIYPVIIDLGSSYVKAIENGPMYTTSEHYQNGLQPTLYDNLNDIHHLLISAFEEIKDKNDIYEWLYYRFLYVFRHLPILATRGWKQLPHNITDLILEKIKNDVIEIDNFSVYRTYQREIVHLLNGLIILPWLEYGEKSFKDCFLDFLEELQKIKNMNSITGQDDILYILREIVDSINSNRNMEVFKEDIKKRISFIIKDNVKNIPKDLDYNKLYKSCLNIANRLSSNYFSYVEEHCSIISEAYLKTPIKGPYDAAKIMLQNVTPSFEITNTNKIYVWNADKEIKQVIIPSNLTKKQLNEVNNACFMKKSKILVEMLEL